MNLFFIKFQALPRRDPKFYCSFEITIMNFFSDLQHDYEDKASKWLVNFQGPNFDIPEELKENVGLIGAMCEVSRLQSIDTSDHLTFQCIYFCFLNIFYQ